MRSWRAATTETCIKVSLWMCRMSVNSYNFSTISGRWWQYCWGILHSFRPLPSYLLQPWWRSCQGSAAGRDHCTTLCPLSRAQSSQKRVYQPSHLPGGANEYVYVLYRHSSKYYSLYLKPCLIHIQVRLADNYVKYLSAVNSVEPYKGQNIVHAPCTIPPSPPHPSGSLQSLFYFIEGSVIWFIMEVLGLPTHRVAAYQHSKVAAFVYHRTYQQMEFIYFPCSLHQLISPDLHYQLISQCPWVCDRYIEKSGQWMCTHGSTAQS